MRCDELRPLHGLYLDSELDARTTLEIEQHLKSCPECARLFAAEQKLEARIKAGLNQGSRTATLWERIEGAVSAGAPSAVLTRVSASVSEPAGWQTVLWALGQQVHAGWRRSRWAWAGLAAVWGVILVLSFTAREHNPRIVVAQGVPSVSEMRFAWKQKQLLMADLAFAPEAAPAEKSRPTPPSPHSERQNGTLNT
jgi:anti-sigma factor RsiW